MYTMYSTFVAKHIVTSNKRFITYIAPDHVCELWNNGKCQRSVNLYTIELSVFIASSTPLRLICLHIDLFCLFIDSSFTHLPPHWFFLPPHWLILSPHWLLFDSFASSLTLFAYSLTPFWLICLLIDSFASSLTPFLTHLPPHCHILTPH